VGQLTIDEFKKIIKIYSFEDFYYFIETGTYNGRTIIPLAEYYPKKLFYTIEIVPQLVSYVNNVIKLKKLKNIKVHKGLSTNEIKKIKNKLSKKKIIFFLDAHSSGYKGTSAGSIHKETKRSQKYFLYDLYLKTLQLFTKKIIDTNLLKNKLSEVTVPLLDEINLIKDIKKRDMLIIIDDLDKFNLKYFYADWSGISINKIKKIINDRKFYIKKMKEKLIVVIKK
jgi:hypothetical protein